MPHWVWLEPKFPNFHFQISKIEADLDSARSAQKTLLTDVAHIFKPEQEQWLAKALLDETLTTAAIEGEVLDRSSVRSSIAARLGLNQAGLPPTQPHPQVDGLLNVLFDATGDPQSPLTLERLCRWHTALFPTGRSGLKKIQVGTLRTEGDMHIISGPVGQSRLHFVAPPPGALPKMLQDFLNWFNDPACKQTMDGIVRTAVAHLWFEIIHPFDEGNGRIGRAIIDLALAQDEQRTLRAYSLSAQILNERKAYYAQLEHASQHGLDITDWISWFLRCFKQAIDSARHKLQDALDKTAFWHHHMQTELNTRQKKALNKMLDQGKAAFEGGMTTRKYQRINKVSRATAFRELKDLQNKGCLKRMPARGRSTAYELIWPT